MVLGGAVAAGLASVRMGRRAEYLVELVGVLRDGPADDAGLSSAEVERLVQFLVERSGLPGPRGNLELIEAFADVAGPGLCRTLTGHELEYVRSCGVVGLGRWWADGSPDAAVTVAEMRQHALDGSWRVREATAMALQRLGDADPGRLRAVVADWAVDAEPLVRRAAVAGICEPRLLKDPGTVAAALAACAAATRTLVETPQADRRAGDVRTLRQALGYCWSVAVAGEPVAGVPAFEALRDAADPDVVWVVRENLRKARLQKVLGGA